MPDLSRRTFVQSMVGASVGAAVPIGPAFAAQAANQDGAAPEARLHWLEGDPSPIGTGSTWGVPWARGTVDPDQQFALRSSGGDAVPTQSWPLAYWPDGSVKWTAHALAADAQAAEEYVLAAGEPAEPANAVTVQENRGRVVVETGVISCTVNKRGPYVIRSISRGEREIARHVELVNLRQQKIDDGDEARADRRKLVSKVEEVTVEQSGPVRAVVRVEGVHSGPGRDWLPFTIRLYFYAGAEHVRIMHTFVFDSDGNEEFIAGLGVRFQVPMVDELYDRHIRFVGEGHGMLTEAIQPITGMRRDPGRNVRAAQVDGKRLPDPSTWDTRVTDRLHWIPAWGDYRLSQLSSEGFTVAKRTTSGHGWVPIDQGGRASGFGYVGGVSGGVGFGLRDFWQRHPTQLDVRDAQTDSAEVTVWLWSPEAPPMDTRFYHDGMGQDTYDEQLDALEITYEDYEPGFGTPYGIARTSELMLWALDATPEAERLGAMADVVRTPPQIVNEVQHLVDANVFGGLFAPVDRSTPMKAKIEDSLDFLFDFYAKQQDQRHWYGFWDYGDIMHSFDEDRSVWRYDVGGYAWDNSELSPDLWLWYSYLRSGRADIFRFAEAMTRHTGEVDVYHIGEWAGLGTRHNVQHWGDSAKQLRISTAIYRRIFYYLTADERTGDLMHELVDAEETFLVLDPIRKIREGEYEPDPRALAIGLGTDWSALAAAWFTEWERRGPQASAAERKVLGTMRTIAAMPNGLANGGTLYNMETGEFLPAEASVSGSSLGAMFGLVEICAELIDAIDMPEFEAAWLPYCRLYNASREEQEAELGGRLGTNLRQGHTRMDAYAYHRLGDATYADRAWDFFLHPRTGWEYSVDQDWSAQRNEDTLNPTDTAAWVSTNTTALYGLAAIQNLALAGDRLPD
ncbi:exo-rhamnogalacturonan lyase family protein [Phytoactinopolyspora halotolerans]|uniref:Tat pathway signal sequence domain protein n=1 Tax=Phytoactinopolyspora halotolerans TaxID=1981512 RepID=A0A6L9SET1_9ACTN|nr:Tat pathway signal sequence domain protein [Phytoactinopolyspora halotolerans]NEE03589.1 Tat pathway signal sequence domain protein [Phytoactinopolyspora halotolerans]